MTRIDEIRASLEAGHDNPDWYYELLEAVRDRDATIERLREALLNARRSVWDAAEIVAITELLKETAK